jgi:hypothetical protein
MPPDVVETPTESKTEALKWEFLNIVFLSVAIGDALKHNLTYAPTKTKREREENGKTLRRELSLAMIDFAQKYKVIVTDADHRKNLAALEKWVTEKCGSVLVGGKVRKEGHLRRGTAQKAFNLYLKFLWCVGRIPTPPHSTVDKTILVKLPKEFQNINWTQIDSEEEYDIIIEAVQKIAGREPLAEWELREWNQANNPTVGLADLLDCDDEA